MDITPLDLARLERETFVARAEYHAVVDSTNNRAKERAAQPGESTPLLIVAGQQTAGRGRGVNRWWTGPGSLAMSLLFDARRWGIPTERRPLVSLAAALAVTETVTGLVPGQPVGLHWPNDVFAAGRKLAGILVEVLPDGQHVLGIGLNTNNTIQDAPPELRDTAVTLRDLTGAPHDPTQLLLDLLRRLDHRLAEVGAAPDRIGQRANALCLQRGQQLLIESGGRQVAGLCVGIATDGALVLDTPAGRQLFHSGVLANSL